jgi:hypothetical protein
VPAIDRDLLAQFCRRHHIVRLALFGSVVRAELHADSDIDVLVEFAPGHTPGFAVVGIQEELSDLLGRQVDLRTAEELSPYFRDDVVRNAVRLYDARDVDSVTDE